MKYANIMEAKREVMRFLRRGEELEIDIRKHDSYGHESGSIYMMIGSPATGAVRRASMDLTRTLAKMRNT